VYNPAYNQNREVPQDIKDLILSEEGSRDYVYTDSEGNLTAGIGHKLTGSELEQYQEGDKLRPGDRTQWFEDDVSRAYEAALEQAERYGISDEDFIARLTSTNFQLGENWWNKDVNPKAFDKLHNALLAGDYNSAAREAIDSNWYLQESGKDINRAEAFGDSIAALTKPVVRDPIEPTPDRRIAFAGTDLSSVFLQNRPQSSFDQTISEDEAIGRASLINPESVSFGEGPKPESLYEKFVAGFEGGVEQTRADYQNLKGALNLAFGNDEAAQLNIAQAEFYEEQAATYLQQLTPFKDFYENPTFGGFIEQVVGGVGKIMPQAMETVASAVAGGGIGFLLKEGVKRTGKAATKQLIKDALKKYRMAGGGTAGLNALSPAERLILEESWKLGNRLVKGGSITGAFLQEYKVGTSQSFSEFKEAGRELTSSEAFAALGLGLPQAIIGTAAEVLFAGALYKMALRKTKLGKIIEQGEKNPDSLKGVNKGLYTIYQKYQKGGQKALTNSELGKLQKAQKDTKYFSNFARDMATLVGISTVSEGTAEALQEGLSVTQRFAIDEDYDAADAKLRIAEATFLGAFAGGGARAIPGAAVTSIFNQARNALDNSFDYRARTEEQESRLGTLTDFKPESDESLNAQLDTVLDTDNKKDSLWVREEDQERLDTAPKQPTEEGENNKQRLKVIANARKTVGKAFFPERSILNDDKINVVRKNFGVEGAILYINEVHDAAIDNINADTTLSDDQRKARIAANETSREKALKDFSERSTGQQELSLGEPVRPKTFSQKVTDSKLQSVILPGQGTFYSSDPSKVNRVAKFKGAATGRNYDRFEKTLASVLGYSEARNQNHDLLLEVVNRKGEVVWQQTMDSAPTQRAKAVEAANLLFRSKGRGLRNYDEIFNTESKAKPRSDEKYFIRIRDPETAMEERVAAATIETVNETEDEEPEVRKSTIDDTDTDDFEAAQAQAEGREADSPDTTQAEGLDFETQQQSAQTDKVKESARGFVEVEGRPNEKGTVRLVSTSGPQTKDAERGIKSKPQPVGSLKPIPLGALIPLDDPLRQKFKTKQLVQPYTQENIDNIKRAQQQVIDYLEGGKDNTAKTPLTPAKQAIVNSINEGFATFFLGLVKQNPDKNFDITQQRTADGQVENRIIVEATPESRAFDQENALNIVIRGFNNADKYANVGRSTTAKKNKRFPTGSPKGQQGFRWEIVPAGTGQLRNLTEAEMSLDKPTLPKGNRYIAMNELLKAGRSLYLEQDPDNVEDYGTSLVIGFNSMLTDVLQDFKVNGVRQHIIFRKLDGTKFADGNDYIDITDLAKTQTQETTPPTDPNRIVHFTLPENVAKILEEGFDTTKPPVHGLRDNDIRRPFDATNKIGEDVVYFTTDEDRWSSTTVYVGEGKGNIEAVYYDYDAQKWVREQDAMVRIDLARVEAGIKDSARVLTLDSYKKVVDYSPAEFAAERLESTLNKAREEGYDVVNIKYENAEKWGTDREAFQKFTKNGGKDDYFILNEESIEVIPTQTPQTRPGEAITIDPDTIDPDFEPLNTILQYPEEPDLGPTAKEVLRKIKPFTYAQLEAEEVGLSLGLTDKRGRPSLAYIKKLDYDTRYETENQKFQRQKEEKNAVFDSLFWAELAEKMSLNGYDLSGLYSEELLKRLIAEDAPNPMNEEDGGLAALDYERNYQSIDQDRQIVSDLGLDPDRLTDDQIKDIFSRTPPSATPEQLAAAGTAQTQTTPTEDTPGLQPPNIQTDLDAVTKLINDKRQELKAEIRTRLEEEKEAALRIQDITKRVETVKRLDKQLDEIDTTQERVIERVLRNDPEIRAALEAIAAETTVAARRPAAAAQDISNLPIWFDMFRQEQGEPAVYSTLRELNEIAPPEETEIAVAVKSLLGKIKQADSITIPNRAINVGKNSTESQNVDGNLVPTVPAVPMNPDIELTLVGREGIPSELKLIQPKLNKDQYAFKDLPGMPANPILRRILSPKRFSEGQKDPTLDFQFSRGDIIPSKENQEKIFILNFLESIQKGDEFRIPSITLNYVNNYLRERNFNPSIRRGVVREGVTEVFVGGTTTKDMGRTGRDLETVPLDNPPGDDVGPIRTMQVITGSYPTMSIRKNVAETYDVNSKEYVLPGLLEINMTVKELGSYFNSKVEAETGSKDNQVDLKNLQDVENLAARIAFSFRGVEGGLAAAYEILSSIAIEFGVNPEVVGSRDSFGEGMQLTEDSPGTSVLDVYGRMSGPTEIESSIIDSRPTDDLTITVDEQQDMADRAKEIKQQRRKTTPEIREVLAERRAGTIAIDDTIDGIDTRNQVFTESSSLKKMNAFMEKYKNNIKNFRGNRTALWFGKVPYSYTGTSHPALAMPKEMRDLASQLSEMFGYPPEYFNSVLINKYEKGAKIAAHRDDEPIFKTDDGNIGGIATISFGGNAAVTITDGKDSRTINTSNGSVYVMPEGRFQFLYKHEVGPAESQRISLTFRHLPEVEQIDDLTKRSFEVVNKRFESATTVKDMEGNRVPLERFKFGRKGPAQFIPSKGANTVRASERIKSFFREEGAKGGPSLIDVMARYVTKNLGYNKNTIVIDAETAYNFTLAENATKYRNPDSIEDDINADRKLNAKIQREQRELLEDENSTGKIVRFENVNVIIIQKTPLQSETDANASQLRLLERRFKDLGHEFGHAFLWQELGVVFKKGEKVIGGLGDEGKSFVIQKSDGTLVPVKNPIFEKLYAAYLEDRGEVSQYQDPEFGFEEWYADKFAAEMFNFIQGTKPRNAVQSFFHRIIKKLQEFYKSLGAEAQKRFGQVPPEFQQYMQNVRDIFKQNLTPQKISRPAKAYYEARKSTIEAATIFNNLGQATKQGVNKIVSTYKNKSAREIWGLRYLLYPTDNLMKDFEKKNPKLSRVIRMLRQQMYTRSKEKAGSTPAYLNTHARRNNSFFTQFLNIFDLSNTKYLAPNEKEEINEVLKIAEDFETNPINVLAEKAKANPTSREGRAHRVRLYLKNFHKAFLEPLGIPFNQKYFPRALAIFELINDPSKQEKLVELLYEYNREAVEKNPKLDFKEVVKRLLNEDEATLDEVDEGETDVTDLAVGGNRKRQRYFKNIPSSALREAGLLQDPSKGIREYLNSMAKRIQYNESFVVNVRSISPAAKSILKSKGIIINQKEKDAGVVTGWKALEANLAEIEAVDPKLEAKIRHIVRGQLGKAGQDMSAGFRNTNSFLLFFNAVTLLTLAPLASFPDLAGPMIHGGDFKGFSDGINFAKDYAFGGKEGRQRARQFALDLGVIAADSLSLYYINAAEQNYMNPMFKKGTDYFFRFTGLEAYTQFTRIFAAQMGKQFMVRAAEGAKKGDKLYAEQLDALGVTPEQVEAAQADDFVLTGKIGRKHQAVRSALGKFVDESIVRPNAAERPGWANNPYFATIWQLKSFYYAYGKVIVGGIGRTMRQRYGVEGIPSAMMPAIMGAALLLPLTALGLELRELIKFTVSGFDASKFRTNRLDWSSYMGELIDRAGVLGPLGLLIPMYEAQKYGDFFIGPALGPTAERIEDLIFDAEVKQNIPVFGTLI